MEETIHIMPFLSPGCTGPLAGPSAEKSTPIWLKTNGDVLLFGSLAIGQAQRNIEKKLQSSRFVKLIRVYSTSRRKSSDSITHHTQLIWLYPKSPGQIPLKIDDEEAKIISPSLAVVRFSWCLVGFVHPTSQFQFGISNPHSPYQSLFPLNLVNLTSQILVLTLSNLHGYMATLDQHIGIATKR